MSLDKNDKIYVAGHRGMVGSAITGLLEKNGYHNIIKRTSIELDLRRQNLVEDFFRNEKPDYVFLAAAKVGGIMANISSPADFMYDNLILEMNVIKAAFDNNVKGLMFLGSSCIYPRLAPQPMKEDYLLTGSLEPTNEAYALAKISGLRYCEYLNKQYNTNYISVMPCNLYGYNDNFDPLRSHVVPALIRKFHEAKVSDAPYVEIWGSGNARRELLFSNDLADACLFLLRNYTGTGFVNIGTGVDYSISEIAETIKNVIGYQGKIQYDRSKPDGMPQKLMDVSKLRDAGWIYKTKLSDGIKLTYEWFQSHIAKDEMEQ